VTFSPDGRRLVTHGKGPVQLWDTTTGKAVGDPKPSSTITFSPDSKTLLTQSEPDAVRLWATETGRAVGPPLRHGDRTMASFSPDGKWLLTWSWDKTARVWDTATGQPVGAPLLHEGQVRHGAFSPDGKRFLTITPRTLRLWNTATGELVGEPHEGDPVRGIWAFAFTLESRTLLTGRGNFEQGEGTVELWDAMTGQSRGVRLRHRGAGFAQFSPDGRIVLTHSTDQVVRLWNAATGKPIGEPFQHCEEGIFYPEGTIFQTRCQGGAHQLWDPGTAKPLGPPLERDCWKWSVSFSPDGKTILVLNQGGAARLVRTPTPLAGEVERLKRWMQVTTGLELDEDGALHPLDLPAWQERYRRLQDLGGAP
jgi:WD40 repeat protein